MRGARPKACGFPPHPAFGHLLPQGEKGAIPRFRSSSNLVPNSIAPEGRMRGASRFGRVEVPLIRPSATFSHEGRREAWPGLAELKRYR